MSVVLDNGALIALARNERAMWIRLKTAQLAGQPPVTHAGVLGQAWRGGSRSARLSQALEAIVVVPLDEPMGRAAGELLAAAGLSDVIDASLALMCADGDEIVTSDHDDFVILVSRLGRHVELIRP